MSGARGMIGQGAAALPSLVIIAALGAVLVLFGAAVQGAAAQPAAACAPLACERCAALCKAYCDASYQSCESAGKRGCPARYRSCSNGCTSELCAQCLPVQHGTGDRRYLPGKTELCRTPGAWSDETK